jgi:hypothetical protein
MRLKMNEERSVAAQMAAGYQRAREKQKGVILGLFGELTGYVRPYASRLLTAPRRGHQSRTLPVVYFSREVTSCQLISGTFLS